MSTPTGYQDRTFKSRELLSPKAQGDFVMVRRQHWRVKPVLLRPNLFHVGSGFVFILHPSSTPLNMRVPIGIMKFAFPLPALCHHQTHSLSSFGWCGSVAWLPAWQSKGHWSNSQSGHIPGVQACERKPITLCLTQAGFSPTLLAPHPLSKGKWMKSLKKFWY